MKDVNEKSERLNEDCKRKERDVDKDVNGKKDTLVMS